MDIASKYNPKEVEPKILQKWLKDNSFSAKSDTKHKPFSIAMPPPNITGILHMGHALNNTIQDVLIRFKRMQGYRSLWMPGTDHAGIATQNVLEKELAKEGLKKEDIGRKEFIKRLWSWRDKYGSTIIEQLKKLGASCDWQRTRFTMDERYSEAVKDVFISLHKKKLIYRDNYIINWCPRCKTALSDEEAAHKEIDGWLYYIKYPVFPKPETKNPHPAYIVVATTRPETMLGDTAVAINPKDTRYDWLKGKTIILPVVERELRLIEDEAIDPEFGTGIVKVTPAHDPVDFMLGKKYKLDFINIMNDDATLNKNVPNDFIDKDRFQARRELLALLEERKLIERKEPYKVNAGHCYRCNTIIEPRISLQWFVRMKPLAKEAIKVVEKDKIKFYPQRWKKVYLNWMYNIHDWCISRQIWWGHRLPVWYCGGCNPDLKLHLSPKLEELDPNNPILRSEFNIRSIASNLAYVVSKEKPVCKKCKTANWMIQDSDVLDTWFSSWLWPFATLDWPKKNKDLNYFYPTNCLITASEILFFWVARMIMSGLEFMKEIPFRDVIIHGTVRDDKGTKMSKSLGNIIDPLEIIDKFGADALRFSLIMLAASGSDVYLSDSKFLVGRNFSNKIWNATRFIFLKIKDNNIRIDNLEFKILDIPDKWILKELNTTVEQITSYLESYSLNEAAKKIYDFFWHVFCDWYIEIIKDNFTPNRAKVSMYILLNSMKLLHPFMPFISEEILQLIKDNTSLRIEKNLGHLDWPKEYKLKIEKKDIEEINALFDSIKEIRNIKADLGLGQKKVKLEVKTKVEKQNLWQDNKAWLQRLTLTSEIAFKNELERVLYENFFWSLNFDTESVDMSVFVSSLNKKIKNLEGVAKKVNARLKNDSFLKQASHDIVNKERDKSKSMSWELERLKKLQRAFAPAK
ncbi:MAG: valine--tRNA ligase [Omnitrophica bacterium]|nr:valine--tRNA ligase [Candidatus Omnitrophota bacterium]